MLKIYCEHSPSSSPQKIYGCIYFFLGGADFNFTLKKEEYPDIRPLYTVSELITRYFGESIIKTTLLQ